MKLGLMLSALVAASVIGCTKKSEDTIKVGVFGPFTGGSAPMGVSMRNGVQIAIDEINASGGILANLPATRLVAASRIFSRICAYEAGRAGLAMPLMPARRNSHVVRRRPWPLHRAHGRIRDRETRQRSRA